MILPLERPTPNQPCLVTGRSDLPVLDFGAHAQGIDPKVVISVPVLKEAAAVLHFITSEAAQAKDDEIAELRAKNARLEEENSELDTVVQAIDSIESAGYRARKKKGPKLRRTVEA